MFTNEHSIHIAFLPWLLKDDYDFIPAAKTISVTTLLRPIRQIVLSQRVTSTSTDVSDLIASRLGSAIHESIEQSWLSDAYKKLTALGYKQEVLDKIIINPSKDALTNDVIPVYLEQRATRKIAGWTVSGKFDVIFDGVLADIKTTSTYAYLTDNKDDAYQKQLSMYWWLNPDKITSSTAHICMLFTDWQKFKVKQNPDYPKLRLATKDIQLIKPDIIEQWVSERIRMLEQELQKDEPIECTDEELWLPKPVYAYYANPLKLDRATKLFDSVLDANVFCAEKGKGIVIPKPREPKRCHYCDAFEICSQRKRMIND